MTPAQTRTTRQLLVVYQSRTGATAQLCQAFIEGASTAAPEVACRLLPAQEAGPADLLAADAYGFAAPEMLAGLGGLMKDFFDRCYYAAEGRIEGRPYAALIAAGSDGQGAARQLARICTGWRLRAVAEPLISVLGAQSATAILAPKQVPAAALARSREFGAALAAGLAMGIF
jgi:multimeric flavodoxin WrbA